MNLHLFATAHFWITAAPGLLSLAAWAVIDLIRDEIRKYQ